ncbi:hypothetical protein HY933_00660 [Candidatus Falkowbacteria bacterium]|nr:hypothetical protein [Candidatus Falkowbacteria bacterium]
MPRRKRVVAAVFGSDPKGPAFSNVGQEEFLNSDFRIVPKFDEALGYWEWYVAATSPLVGAIQAAKKAKQVFRGLTIVAFRKTGPAVFPWVVLVDVKRRQILHLFMASSLDALVDEGIPLVVGHLGYTEKVISDLCTVAGQVYQAAA